MCAIRSKQYGWDLRKKAKTIFKKKTQKGHFGLFIFSQKLCMRMKRFFTVILHRITAACVQLDQNRIAGILKERQTQFKKHKKGHFWTFYNFSKTVQALETIFYSNSTSYYGTMCAIRS